MYKKTTTIILAFIATIFTLSLYAQNEEPSALIPGDDEKKVIATGYGETMESALENALRNAVEEAAGAFMSSTTIVENDEIIKDEVLSLSHGFIKEYRKLAESKELGEFKTVVAALVTEKQILKTLEAKGIKVDYNAASVFEQYQAWDRMKNDELALAKSLFEIKNIKDFGVAYDYQVAVREPERRGNDYIVKADIVAKSNNNYEAEYQNLKNILSELSYEVIETKYTMPMPYAVSANSSNTVTYNRYMYKVFSKNRRGKIKSKSHSLDMILPEFEHKIIGKRNAYNANRRNVTFKLVGKNSANQLLTLFFNKYEKELTTQDKNRLNDNQFNRYSLVYDFFEKEYSPYVLVLMEGSSMLSDCKFITFYKFLNEETIKVIKDYMTFIFEDNHCQVLFEMGEKDDKFIPDAYYSQLFRPRFDIWSDEARCPYQGYVFFKQNDLSFKYPIEKKFSSDEFQKIKKVSIEPYKGLDDL
jgi:hypothetical protein